jgi:hypothetical protein
MNCKWQIKFPSLEAHCDLSPLEWLKACINARLVLEKCFPIWGAQTFVLNSNSDLGSDSRSSGIRMSIGLVAPATFIPHSQLEKGQVKQMRRAKQHYALGRSRNSIYM